MSRSYVVRWRRFEGPWRYYGTGGVGTEVLAQAVRMPREVAEHEHSALESAGRTNGRYLIVETLAYDDARAEGRCQ